MDAKVCEKFDNVWEFFPDELGTNGEYEFKEKNFLDSYCYNGECSSDFGKINAGFFYLLNQFFESSGLSYNVQNNTNVVEYIILWLSYMLNLKSTQDDSITNLNNFYKVNVDKHKKYNSFIDPINKKKELMNISKDKVSKLYKLFKILCEMYTKIDEDNKNCNKYLNDDNQFDKIYKELNNDSSYSQLLTTLSTDYNKLKEKCKNISSSQPKGTEHILVQSSVDISSSSSIGNKLISVLSIFGAIGFLLGISYKYSLFGFRKRFQKQKLREKIKNIKKKMNQ
ncbi:PIR protein [Plasmodium yoelii]|uniref:PIR protein n=3 Tax=Plasmodium yoelii TaxID=5861 RepID=A0AAF0B0B6_PLAYO|nr:PIR protein [Plasmodium yoelii]EAA22169.1 putative yir4 protein [Plasmodium yoelii yoelii]WBY57687.1 PIR protein [Plasmodium yoelii yoelii]CDU18693.1 YIR protein [Plasmodium yoelii]VTZ78704.1 PIR protein [Plasmodium yoelii]|eukprot:XP_022811075.2 PIR protein [Plasmodium yoelii]